MSDVSVLSMLMWWVALWRLTCFSSTRAGAAPSCPTAEHLLWCIWTESLFVSPVPHIGCTVAQLFPSFTKIYIKSFLRALPWQGSSCVFFFSFCVRLRHKNIHIVTGRIIELVLVVLFDAMVPLQQLSFSIVPLSGFIAFFGFSLCHIFTIGFSAFFSRLIIIFVLTPSEKQKPWLGLLFFCKAVEGRKWITSQGDKVGNKCSCWVCINEKKVTLFLVSGFHLFHEARYLECNVNCRSSYFTWTFAVSLVVLSLSGSLLQLILL